MAEATEKKWETLLTPEVQALVGMATDPVEMYDVVSRESIRRFVIGIPDQDPRHWDEELARERFGGVTCPPLMLTYIANRKPPYQAGPGMRRTEQALPSIASRSRVTRHLHGGDEWELFRYPKLGDRIFYQRKYTSIEEKFGRGGAPFLVATFEVRYWNQDNETILIHRQSGVYRE